MLALVALPVSATIPQKIVDHANTRPHPTLFPLLTWLRDNAVELVFGHHPKQTGSHSAEPTDPLPKQYTDEVVLRFNVTSYQQEEAIADAAARLFLDVWTVTRDFVDIRLQKDRIRPLLSLLPKPLHESYKTLIPDVSAMVHGTPPSTPFNINEASRGKDDNSLRNLATDTDNVFFRDYRPLTVRVMGLPCPLPKLMKSRSSRNGCDSRRPCFRPLLASYRSGPRTKAETYPHSDWESVGPTNRRGPERLSL